MTDIISVIISAFSLVVAIVALWLGEKRHRKTIALERRIVEIEEQRERERQLSASQASLHARFEGGKLYVVNSGKAEARNVRVKLDGVPLNEHPVAVRGSDIPTLIGANSEVSCVLAITLDSPPPPYKIEIRWEDDSGANRIYRGTLTF